MRLTCPNCGTQYEVDASAIPIAGRDVQCGSCSTTWFQPPEGVKLPPELERSGLRDWEAAESTPTPELPGEAPEIDTAPNEDIVSEPDLEELIETTELVEQDLPSVAPAENDDATASTTAEIPGEHPDAAPAAQPIRDEPDAQQSREAGSQIAAAASVAPAGAALARSVTGSTPEQLASPEPDTAGTELQDTRVIEAESPSETELVEDIIQEDLQQDVEELERLDGVSEEITVAEAELPEMTSPQVIPEPPENVESGENVEKPAARNVADAIRAAASDLAPENKPGSPLPEDLSSERLADYDEVEGSNSGKTALVEEAADRAFENADVEELIAPSQGYSAEELRSQVREAMDSAIEDQSSRLVSGTFGEGNNPDLNSELGVTESLAAKLKARVTEAAQAQTEAETKSAQSGTLLAASAAGVAAAAGQRVTEFPKRDTEDLSTSLRPKSLARSGLKPGLRPTATPEPKKTRFRFGFVTAILIFSVLVLLYAFRTPIAELIPALSEPLTLYAQTIDKMRMIIQDSYNQLAG